MMTLPTPNVDNWLDDGELHWTQVDEETYANYPINEIRSTWVNDPDYSAE